MIYLYVFVITLVISIVATILIKGIAAKSGFYDMPHNELKTHTEPTPYAGAAIWLSFMVVMLGLRIFTSYETGTLHQLRGIVYGGTLMFLLGLMDDIFDLHYIVKFIGQALAVAILIQFDIYIKIFPHPITNYIISLFWVILVVNALNIIDVMDGLAPGVAALSSAGFFLVALPTEKIYVNFTSLILFSALAGFWLFNRPTAKVFMGDAGSLFAGFILAASSMGADYSSGHMIGIFAPFLILGVPIYDTLLVVYFRYRKGLPVFKGSKDHYALRMKRKGLSVWQIDMISYIVTAVLCFSAFAMTVLSQGYATLLLTVIVFTGIIALNILTETADNF